MGNWNRRYRPRKKFKRYDYEDPTLSPPRFDNTQSRSSGVGNNGLLSWEIDYCYSVRVPWQKVLASKKYIFCHPSVLNWDDSAGKEALKNAKQRYWAMINGLPCNNPLPDPDIYVDEVDWNPFVDPKLIADLDQAFNSDDTQKVDKLETINEEVGYGQAQSIFSSGNAWERDHVPGPGNLKDDVPGWRRWEDSVNQKNDNPWEQNCSQLVDPLKDNAWRSGNESWGWHHGIDNAEVRQEGWSQGDNNFWNWNVDGFRKLGDRGYSRGHKYFTGSNTRGWSVNRDESWGWKDNRISSSGWRKSGFDGNGSNYWDSQRFKRGGRSSHGGYQKRESSLQHSSKYKNSRYHSDMYGNSCHYVKEYF